MKSASVGCCNLVVDLFLRRVRKELPGTAVLVALERGLSLFDAPQAPEALLLEMFRHGRDRNPGLDRNLPGRLLPRTEPHPWTARRLLSEVAAR